MNEAVKSGVPGDEQCEWSRVHLASLYFQKGQTDYSKMHAMIAVENRPNYVPAMILLAEIYMKEGNILEAQKIAEKVYSQKKNASTCGLMCELSLVKGKSKEAAKYYEEGLASIIDHHSHEHNHHAGHHHHDTDKGQYALEAAKFIIKHRGNLDLAIDYLQHEYKARPNNIEVNQYIEKALRLQGKTAEAMAYAKQGKIKI
jgi:tetratricopeptide (TPR) repeat protein